MKRIFLWLLLFFSLGVAGTFETQAAGEEQKASYEIILQPDETVYELQGKIFEETIENAYPGMLLPIREIKIVNRHTKAVQLELDMDLVEPDFSWVNAQLICIQNGVAKTIPLDQKEQSVEDKQIQLQPNEEVMLRTLYQLDGEKITNEHQDKLFKLKWYLRCVVEREEDGKTLPETGEKVNSWYWGFFILGIGIILLKRIRCTQKDIC